MKALVTGAGGFVGPHLHAHLEHCGDTVVTSDRVGANGVDIADRGAVHELLARHRPDVVYHLAAVTHVGESWREPNRVVRVNVEGTANMLDACIAAGVARVLVVGSAEEYGKVGVADPPLREDAPLRPTTPYGASKVAASFFALQAYLGAGLATIRVRSFGHTGPGQSDRFLIPALARRVAQAERSGADEIAVGALDPVRDIGDVRDFVRAYRLLATQGRAGAVYNVCTGRARAVREIADTLVAMSTRPLRLATDPDLLRPVEVPRLVGDPTLLHTETGWEPQYALDRTLADVLAAARAAT